MKKLIYLCCILAAITSFRNSPAVDADTTFMVKAAQGNLAEIDAANVALSMSSSDSVKVFAQMMITDHTKALQELKDMASKQSVMLPDSTDPQHMLMKQQLIKTTGSAFDATYIKGQVKDHVTTVALFESEASYGKNADCKAWATNTLPTLKMHLAHVQGLASKMSKM